MAKAVLTAPTRLSLYNLTEVEVDKLHSVLRYQDQRLQFEYNKFSHSHWFAQKHGIEAFKEELKAKRALISKCLLFEDDDGFWTYSGLAETVGDLLGCTVESRITYPKPQSMVWERKPAEIPYPYQDQMIELMPAAKHCHVEVGTGLGKTLALTHITRKLGLKTLVMAPSADIAYRIYEDFVRAFGEKKVGFFGDGKKKVKHITVGIGASLTRVKEGSAEWKALAGTQVFIADESHQCPAATLTKVCFGLAAAAPYRFFFSATQMRNDGLGLLLEAIIGPCVLKKTVREGIEEGYLAALDFVMLHTQSSRDFEHPDPNEMTRKHMFYNPRVYKGVAEMINRFVKLKKQVLVLVDELEQFTYLNGLLKVQVKFAHGSSDKPDTLPKEFWVSDPSRFVKEFNNEEFPVLVGTSCICTGTDLKANEVTIYLRGGRSEIEVMQGACGRSTRKFTFKDGRKKTRCLVIDVDVDNVKVTHRHSESRRKIYQDIAPVRDIRFGG